VISSRTLARTATPIAVLSALFTLAACSSGDTGSGESTCATEGQALKVCSTGPVLKGVDVSKYQANVSWSSVKSSGRSFAFARVSDGVSYPDSYFATNWSGIKAAGLVRGAYQYFRPAQDPVAQADLMIAKLGGKILTGDLPAVLDLETTDGLASATVVARAKTWLARVEAGTGKRPIVYTAAFMSSTIGTSFSAYPLWVANYGTTCPTLPTGWSNWKFWQSASTGSVPGIAGNVDVNDFQGTLADLKAFAGAAPSGDAGTIADAGSTEEPESLDVPPAPTHDSSGGDDVYGGSVMGDGLRVNATVDLCTR
jgi:lysozyme